MSGNIAQDHWSRIIDTAVANGDQFEVAKRFRVELSFWDGGWLAIFHVHSFL
jgi:hypothetical protein